MTTVVSRLYADAKTADSVSKALRKNGHPDSNIDVISAGDSDHDALALRITEARVSGAAAARYAERLEGDRRLLVVRVPFMPLGAAKNAIETVDRFESIGAGVAKQNEYLREEPSREYFARSVLKGSPLFLTTKLGSGRRTPLSRDLEPKFGERIGLISARLGLPLLRDRPRRSAITGGGFMSTKLLPFPLLKEKRRGLSVIRGGGTPFSTLLALPLLTARRDDGKSA